MGYETVAKTLYKDTGYSLTHLVEDIRHGNIALPDIQRPFVWSSTKIRDLFDSMYRGYPVGTLMFWETGAEVGTRQVGGGESAKVASKLIVDGQQRLTSLYAVLTGSAVLTKTFERKRIRIAFRPADETFEVADAAIEKDPEFLPDLTALWRDGSRPTVRQYLSRLVASRPDLNESEKDLLADRIDRVHDLQSFRFQVVELNSSADEEQVADIFVRINSEGVQLKQSDFILTLMSVHWEAGRRELEQFCQAAADPGTSGPSPRNPFIEPSADQLLRASIGLAFRRGRLQHVYSILRGKDLETGEVSTDRRTQQFMELQRAQDDVLHLSNWHEYLKCLTHAGFRSKRMVTSETALIYTYVFWLIGRRDFGLDLRQLRGVIARWFFMAHTTGRYTSSPESALEADLGRVAVLRPGDGAAFCEELDRIVRSNFTRDYWEISLPNRLDTSSSRSPALFAYWAALNLLDADLLFSDLRVRDLLDPQTTAPRSIERHHLFPKAFLSAHGIKNPRQVNAIANMAFTDWPQNATIRADDPADYWPIMSETMADDQLKRQTHWHALPMGWPGLDYTTFLERRRTLIARVVHEGFERLQDGGATARPVTLIDLLSVGESQSVEYKSTARFNTRTGQRDERMEHVIAKTVCGFFNAEGGTLLIGVNDNAQVLGLEDDFRTLGAKGNIDGYELYLRQYLDTALSISTAGRVRIRFEQQDGLDVCVVSVSAAGRPVFAKPVAGGQARNEFWVRIGNATKQLHGDDMVDYQSEHWA